MLKTDGDFDPSKRNIYFLAGSYPENSMTIETDGIWDNSQRNAYFLATDNGQTNNMLRYALIHPYLLCAVNEIDDKMLLTMENAQAMGAHWFIDSGIFWLTNEHKRRHNITMDEALSLAPEDIDGFNELFDKYIGILKLWKDKCWGYIELDQGGRDNKIKTRQRLEDMGFRPIPVYHPLNDGWDYFDYLAERYDRICFGNIVQAPSQVRKRLLATAFQRKQKYPHLWIHILGYTPSQTMNAFPIDSCDSSSWLSVVRWNGHTPRSMLKAVGHMDERFQYKQGDLSDYPKAIAMSAFASHCDMQTWKYHIERQKELGIMPELGKGGA